MKKELLDVVAKQTKESCECYRVDSHYVEKKKKILWQLVANHKLNFDLEKYAVNCGTLYYPVVLFESYDRDEVDKRKYELITEEIMKVFIENCGKV